jgi:formylglycine-generating enzyme required for sulfatase activity
MVRGGSWYSLLWFLRAAYRDGLSAVFRNTGFGFRVGRTLN